MERFCEDEYKRLVGSLGLFCGDRDLAEELAQETLIRACVDWNKLERADSPRAWLHTVGMNLARSHFRRRAAEHRAAERLAHQPHPSALPDSVEVISIPRAIASLPYRRRKALVLRYYVDLRVEDIATAMDCSTSTVKSLIRAALESLRAEEGIGFNEGGEAIRAV